MKQIARVKDIRHWTYVMLCSLLLLFIAGCGNEKASAPTYELYPTQNFYTFLKLNTKTGQVSQVQYAINNEDRFETVVNDTPLVAESASEVGRFKLSPTHNMYNFLLLDQITGQVWQVQWHIEDDKRGIIGEIKRMQ
jgi:hypothetical protein